MAENSTDSKTSAETNIITLKEALCAQQRLLQKLYNELDVEREASATAASEALAMILRLQGEKSAIKMEAEHYKRLAEEKMHHAEESMQVFEDLIYQKEMEIASLDYQVQAYRYKLSSFGIDDLGVNEIKFPENLLQQNESLSRRNSAPPKLFKFAYLKRDRSVSPDSDIVLKKDDETRQNVDSENINSFWDQICKLDKIVEEVAGDQFHISRTRSSRSSSVFSQINESDQTQIPKKRVDQVLDVFEVPQSDEIVMSYEEQVKDNGKSILNGEKIEELVSFTEEAMKQKDKQMFFPIDEIVIDCHMAVDFASSSREANARTEITVEDERQLTSTGREEELRLLYEIREKLDSIQSEIRIRNTKTKKSSTNHDVQMLQLTEAMLHFWL